jgi:hypothetical protein
LKLASTNFEVRGSKRGDSGYFLVIPNFIQHLQGRNFPVIAGVTLKVFTPCLEVLHEIWGTWYMISPWMIRERLEHRRWLTQWFIDLSWVLV